MHHWKCSKNKKPRANPVLSWVKSLRLTPRLLSKSEGGQGKALALSKRNTSCLEVGGGRVGRVHGLALGSSLRQTLVMW